MKIARVERQMLSIPFDMWAVGQWAFLVPSSLSPCFGNVFHLSLLKLTEKVGYFPVLLLFFSCYSLKTCWFMREMCLKSLHLVSSVSYANKAMLLPKSAKLGLHQVHSYHRKYFKLIFHGQLKCSEDLRD